MGDLEFFRLDKDGAGWENISKAPKEVLDSLKRVKSTDEVKMLCFVCHKNIAKGNVCVDHRSAKGAIYLP